MNGANWDLFRDLHFPALQISDAVEIVLLFLLMYWCARRLRGTRAWLFIKGAAFCLAGYALTVLFSLDVLRTMMEWVSSLLPFVIIVVFQQDIRHTVENMGTRQMGAVLADWLASRKGEPENLRCSDQTIEAVTDAAFRMGKEKTGALIVFERDVPLTDCIASGIELDAKVTSQLLINIFEKNTPLHDGAVVIRRDRAVSATSYLRMSSSMDIPKDLGTRHRAAIGASENADCVVVIVSEETGDVSLAEHGHLARRLSPNDLKKRLRRAQETGKRRTEKKGAQRWARALRRNTGIKLAALGASCGLWCAMTLYLDPVTERVWTSVPVEMQNAQALKEAGQMYTPESGENIAVTIRGRRSEVSKIRDSQIHASADLSRLTSLGTTDIQVQVDSEADLNVRASEQVVKVAIEDIHYGEYPIECEVAGAPVSGMQVAGTTLNRQEVTVTGGEKLIRRIGRVCARVDVSGLEKDSSLTCPLAVYDRNGDLIDPALYTLSQQNVEVKVQVARIKIVAVRISTRDEEGSAGIVQSVSFQPVRVEVIGTAKELDGLSEIAAEVPIRIDVADAGNTKLSKVITLQDYLPEGVQCVTPDQKVTLDIVYQPYPSRVLTVPASQVQIQGDGALQVRLNAKTITVRVFAEQSVLRSLKSEDIRMYVDTTDLKPGRQKITVQTDCTKKAVAANVEADAMVSRRQG